MLLTVDQIKLRYKVGMPYPKNWGDYTKLFFSILHVCPHNLPGCRGEFLASPANVIKGNTTSCGCIQRAMRIKKNKDPNFRVKISDGLSKPKLGQSIGEKFPELIKEWSNKNEKTVYEVSWGSAHKYWWKCHKDHHSLCAPSTKIYYNIKCPICDGKKVLKGYNDLLSQYPEIAKEWNYNKNDNLIPESFVSCSNKKVWWKCTKCYYIWKVSINNRTSGGTGCPHCNSSRGEKIIKKWLDGHIKYEEQKRFKDCKNKRPLPFDFYISELQLAIEYQGEQHYKQLKVIRREKLEDIQYRDSIKKQYCKDKNINLLIIPYWDLNNIEDILHKHINSL